MPNKPTNDDIARFRTRLTGWYRRHHRKLPWRDIQNAYHTWVSEVMLQQTQVQTVIPYFQKFIEKFPDIPALASAKEQDVLKAWEGLGYYARARNFQKAAKMITEKMQGNIPDNYQEFRSLPGVGDYIAAAVMSIAFDQPFPVVDGNVKRVLARLHLLDSPVNKSTSQKIFLERARQMMDFWQPGLFNQAMMELGATVCKPGVPLCRQCPVSEFCLAYQSDRQVEFPKRTAGKAVPEYRIAVGVIYKDGKLLITRRKNDGLLGGLWEFPGGKIQNNESAPEACKREIREEIGIDVQITSFVTRIKHAYTHFKISMDVFFCRYAGGEIRLKGPVDYRWITPEEIDEYPFPGANHKFIPLVKNMYPLQSL